MRLRQVCYRAHDPRWAFSPLSGEGAAIRGARFNPKGTPALYLGLSIDGTILEVSYGLGHRIQPLTICAYDVDVADLVDLSTASHQKAAGVSFADMSCAWSLDLSNGRKPASWKIAESLVAQGAAGIVVPSLAVGATPDAKNLVLWNWGPSLPHRVELIDPKGALPRDQKSWG